MATIMEALRSNQDILANSGEITTWPNMRGISMAIDTNQVGVIRRVEFGYFPGEDGKNLAVGVVSNEGGCWPNHRDPSIPEILALAEKVLQTMPDFVYIRPLQRYASLLREAQTVLVE